MVTNEQETKPIPPMAGKPAEKPPAPRVLLLEPLEERRSPNLAWGE